MRYKSQSVAYWYFAVAMVLFGLQIVFGILSATKYLGPDPLLYICLLYTSPSPRDGLLSRMPSSA